MQMLNGDLMIARPPIDRWILNEYCTESQIRQMLLALGSLGEKLQEANHEDVANRGQTVQVKE